MAPSAGSGSTARMGKRAAWHWVASPYALSPGEVFSSQLLVDMAFAEVAVVAGVVSGEVDRVKM